MENTKKFVEAFKESWEYMNKVEDILNGGNIYYEAVKECAKKENSEVVLI